MRFHAAVIAFVLLFVLGLALTVTPSPAEPAMYVDVEQMIDQSEADIPIGHWQY